MKLTRAYLVVGGALLASLVSSCSDDSTPDRGGGGTGGSAGNAGSSGSNGNAGSSGSSGSGGNAGNAGTGGSGGSLGRGGSGGAGGSELDAGPDADVCAPPARLGYVTPGCDGTVQPVCAVFTADACAQIACSCAGETITGACDHFSEPYAYAGECSDAGADASAP